MYCDFEFTVGGDAATYSESSYPTFDSWTETNDHFYDCSRPTPDFRDGDARRCWAPARDLTAAERDAYYCENEPCYKVYNPEGALDYSSSASIVGLVTALINLAVVGPCCWNAW